MTTRRDALSPEVKVSGLTIVVFVVLYAALVGLVALRSRPPAPLGVDAPAGTFSAGRAMERLEQLLAERVPHPAGSAADAVIRERIVAGLAELGLEAELQQGVACSSRGTCAQVTNVVSRLPGTGDGPAVLLSCHYDSVAAGPGAADDMSGVAVLLEVARILEAEPAHRNPVVLLFNEGEESGLLGARLFMQQLPEPAAAVGAALNVEARGTGGLSLMFETSGDNAWLMEQYARHVPRPAATSLSVEIYRRMPNDTDLSAFMDHGLAGMNFAYIGRPSHYHTPLDNTTSLDPGSVQHQGESVLAMTRALAEADLGAPRPGGDAVYTDVLGLVLLRWPAALTLPLAVLALVLLAAAITGALRKRLTTGRGLAFGLLAFAATLVVSALAGWGLTSVVAALTGLGAPWPADPMPSRVAVWAGVAAVATAAAWLLRRRTGCWGMALAVWTGWALAGAGLAVPVPGVAIIFVAPALLAGVLLAAGAWGAPRMLVPALVAASLAAGALWLPLVLLFELSFGFGLSAAVGLTLALAAATFAPLFASEASSAWRGGVVLAAAAVAAVALVVACLQAPHSPWSPRRLNILHFEDADSGEARWVVSQPPAELPPSLVAAGGLVATPRSEIFPWSGSSAEYAAGPALATADPAPVLELVAAAPNDGGRSLDLLLRSPRGSRTVWMMVPEGAQALLSATVGGQELAPDLFGDDRFFLQVVALPAEGMPVHLELEGAEPLPVLLGDRRDGLPDGAGTLLDARPDWCVPGGSGDTSLLLSRTAL